MGGFENEIERARNERVIIVDDDNAVVGSAPRHEMRTKRLPHRATFILVFDSDGRILVQKRTDTKDVYPGYHDLAAGGVVTDGESYEESAFREAAEELGIRGVPLEYQFDFYYQDPGNRCFGRVYSCVCEGPFETHRAADAGHRGGAAAISGAGIPGSPNFSMMPNPLGAAWALCAFAARRYELV
jgi:ADP-ribose pyrophosphatase YjhB (NUDIX family)